MLNPSYFSIEDLRKLSEQSISKYVNSFESMDLQFFPWPWEQGAFEKFISKDDAVLSYLVLNDEVVAFFVGHREEDLEQVYLLKIIVSPLWRGKGLGRRMMELTFEDLASTFGINKCYCEVDVENTVAIELYKSLGLEVLVRKKKFYSNGNDAYAMQCHLLK